MARNTAYNFSSLVCKVGLSNIRTVAFKSDYYQWRHNAFCVSRAEVHVKADPTDIKYETGNKSLKIWTKSNEWSKDAELCKANFAVRVYFIDLRFYLS